MPDIRSILAANRSEIAIRIFRAANEIGLRTIAIYSHEDRFGMHRLKADEAYAVGAQGEPIRSYLNIAAIIEAAHATGSVKRDESEHDRFVPVKQYAILHMPPHRP